MTFPRSFNDVIAQSPDGITKEGLTFPEVLSLFTIYVKTNLGNIDGNNSGPGGSPSQSDQFIQAPLSL